MTVRGPARLLYLTLGVLCLGIGAIGLVIPVLPGALFLAGALYLLSRGSGRIRRMAAGHPVLGRLQSRMEGFDAASAAASGLASCISKVRAVGQAVMRRARPAGQTMMKSAWATGQVMLQGAVLGAQRLAGGARRLFL